MKLSASALLTLVILILVIPELGGVVNAAERDTPKTSLTFLTWSEYIDPEIVSSFEQRYDAEINFIYFETDDGRDELMVQTDGKGFDLILANDDAVAKYARAGWLASLEKELIPNLRHVDPSFFDYHDDTRQYSVPYFWGTIGIAYRSDLYTKPVTSWRALFEPAPELAGRIAMIRSSLDVIGMALKTLGYSMNSENLSEIAAVEPMLRAQRPKVSDYSYHILDETSALVTGEIKMAMMYSGDALLLREMDPRIKYVVPEEGTGKWIDYIVMAQAGKNRQLAHEFLNYINDPARAAKNAFYMKYATPNSAAEAMLPAEMLTDPVIYPPAEVLARTEIFGKLSARALRARNQLFANVSE